MQAHGTSTESLRHISEEVTRMQLRRLGSSLAPLPESPTSSGPPDSQGSDLPLLAVGRLCCLEQRLGSLHCWFFHPRLQLLCSVQCALGL